nr:aspartyl-phosphate phosphatase Spo0E family protein [Thermobacillus sp. ZCTH02-B1]
MKRKSLLGQLQTLRFRLHELAEARGSLTDPEVLALSEEADRLIVALQQMQRDELTIPGKQPSAYDRLRRDLKKPVSNPEHSSRSTFATTSAR